MKITKYAVNIFKRKKSRKQTQKNKETKISIVILLRTIV